MASLAFIRFPAPFGAIPWFVPGIVVSSVVGALLAPAVARVLHAPKPVAWLLVFSVGVILSATLTPIPGGQGQFGSCDFRRLGLLPLSLLLRPNEASLNVLLFVPLGVSIGLLPRIRGTFWLVAGAVSFPFVIEGAQSLLAGFLGRGCQSADVFDNLTGLLIGLAIGATVHLVTNSFKQVS